MCKLLVNLERNEKPKRNFQTAPIHLHLPPSYLQWTKVNKHFLSKKTRRYRISYFLIPKLSSEKSELELKIKILTEQMREEMQGEISAKFKEAEQLKRDMKKLEQEFLEKIQSIEKSANEKLSLLLSENEELTSRVSRDQENLKLLTTLQEDRKRLLLEIEQLKREGANIKEELNKVRIFFVVENWLKEM